MEVEPVIEDNGGMRMRSVQELEYKRKQYATVLMLNVEKAI